MVGDPRPAGEWEDLTRRRLDLIAGVQLVVEAEGLHIKPRADVPPATQTRVATEVQLLVLSVALMEEMRALPLIVEQEIASERLQHRPTLAEPCPTMIDAGVNDPWPRDKSAARQEVLADAGEDVAEAEFLPVPRELAFPESCVARQAGGLVEAPRGLKRRGVDISEDDAAVDVGYAIVIAAEHAIGVGDADPRFAAEVPLGAQQIVEGAVKTGRRQTAIIRGREQTDTHAGDFPGEFDRGVGLHHSPGVNEVVRSVERFEALEEEGSLLGEEQCLPRLGHELPRVGFDLGEIRIHSAVQRQGIGNSPLQASAELRRPAVIRPPAWTRPTSHLLGDGGIDVEHESA